MKEGLRLMYQAQNQCIQQMTYSQSIDNDPTTIFNPLASYIQFYSMTFGHLSHIPTHDFRLAEHIAFRFLRFLA